MSAPAIQSRKRPLPRPLDLSAIDGKKKRSRILKKSSDNVELSKIPEDCLSPTETPRLFPGSDEKAKDRYSHLVCSSDSQIGPYFLITEFDATGYGHAINTSTQSVRKCQLLTNAQYEHILNVTQRMNQCSADADLRELILPRQFEVLTDSRCRRVAFFAPDFDTLHSRVQHRNVDEREIRQLYAQIVRLVAFCHSLGIVIRDLKLRKFVFIDESRTKLRLASVHDLVVCRDINEDRLHDRHGCPAYVSPEILDLQRGSYSGKAADMWSLGVLLFVMFVGRYPFYDTTAPGLFDKIRQARFCIPEVDMSMEARIVLHGLLRPDPEERPSAQQLMAIPWLQSRNKHHQHTVTNVKCEKDQTVPSLD